MRRAFLSDCSIFLLTHRCGGPPSPLGSALGNINYRLALYMLNIFVNIFCCKYKNNKKYEDLTEAEREMRLGRS